MMDMTKRRAIVDEVSSSLRLRSLSLPSIEDAFQSSIYMTASHHSATFVLEFFFEEKTIDARTARRFSSLSDPAQD